MASSLSLPLRLPSCHPATLKARTVVPKTSVSASSSPAGWEREEARWLREEQRWLREEQRWLRQESRLSSERDSLLREIDALRRKVEDLERRSSALGLGSGVQVLGQIAETGSGGVRAMLLEEGEVKEMVAEEVRVSESAGKGGDGEKKEEKTAPSRRTLRVGSEGEDVRQMQEALQSLGFYSGDEDIEYSSFSSGTERAVKTWQASLGSTEDGVMTVDLLRILQEMIETDGKVEMAGVGESLSSQKMGKTNGVPVTSVTEISETKQTAVKGSESQFEVSQHKVFLLGENRWEETSRLIGRKNKSAANNVVSAKKCLSCRGEGRLMCTECDGSGEPNIEPQFLEWVDEDAKCPYCEGLGYTICDVCDGKTVV